MYSLGLRFSSGASDVRIMYSLSRRCIMKGSQARPDSIQTTLSLGKRSGRPLITQLVMWTMLQSTNDSACIDEEAVELRHRRRRPSMSPAWKASGMPRSSSIA